MAGHGDRAHDSIIRQRSGTTILDEARESLGFNGSHPATTAEDSRKLLREMMRILDAKHGTQLQSAPQPAPQAIVPVVTRPPSMPVMRGELTGINARLRPLWSFWSKHVRKYHLPSYATPRTPPTPPLQMLPLLLGEADNMRNKLEMLLELDRQVEAAWKAGRVKDDDRKLAADRVISTWEAKMHSYSNVRSDGTPDTGSAVALSKSSHNAQRLDLSCRKLTIS